MRRGIIAGGNWIVDHLKMIDAWPAQDTLATIRQEASANGGSPYNILIDLARLGATFPLAGIGLVGDDADGRGILADCAAHGIDTTQLRATAGAATSYTDVMTVAATGRRTFFHQRGANALLDETHFDFTATPARHFHLGYLLLLDRLDERTGDGPRALDVLRRARVAGLTTSIDCVSEHSDRFRGIVLPILPQVDVLFANDFEAEKLTGVPLRKNDVLQPAAVIQAADILRAAGVRSWVVIHFPEGAYARAPAATGLWQPSLNVASGQIAGAAGAGDALAAGVLFGLHEDWEMARCLKLGVAAAGACLFDPSCSGGIGSAAAAAALAERLGYRELPAAAL